MSGTSNPALEALGVSLVPGTIQTASSSATATSVTILNTNALGGKPVIVNATGSASLDLSRTGSCMTLPGAANLDIANNASVSSSLDAGALTGANMMPGGRILTGDASAQANVVNILNTNLVGSCWNFTVLNVFNDPGGNIILPYELPFLDLHASDLHPVSHPGAVTIANNALLSQNANAIASTGDNMAAAVKTGTAESKLRLIGIANTDIIRGNWLLLQVHAPDGWAGSFENWWGESLTAPTDSYAWIRLPESSGPGSPVNIINNATVSDNVTARADTGANAAPGGSVETGNAKSSVNIFDLVNTNIVGNNWYFAVVNLFGKFAGNIVFPRPDLAVSGTTETGILPGASLRQSVTVKNTGTYEAGNVRLSLALPPHVSCEEAPGAVCGAKIDWNLGKMEPGTSRTVDVLLLTDKNTPAPGSVSTVAVAATSTDEPATGNNTVVLVSSVDPAPVAAAAGAPPADFPVTSPGPSVAPSPAPRQVKGVTAILADYKGRTNGVVSVRMGAARIADPAGERTRNLAGAFLLLVLLRLAAWGWLHLRPQ